MEVYEHFVGNLQIYGVGRRKLSDALFANDTPPSRLGTYDDDVVESHSSGCLLNCMEPGCKFTTDSVFHYENHYNAMHRYSCSQCRKTLPSSHLLDLHIQEHHDSFFAVMAEKTPSYSCYIEECKDKFVNSKERLNHCVKIHKLPRQFRFDYKQDQKSKSNRFQCMNGDPNNKEKINFTNSKQKGFTNYKLKKFTEEQNSSASVNIDAIMTDLKKSLPKDD